jgi:hypothetical protein
VLGRTAPAALLALPAIAAALAGCGGGSSSGSSSKTSAGGDTSAANLVPASAAAFVAIDTDTSSDQLQSADAVLKKFPGRARVIAELQRSAHEEGVSVKTVLRSIGPETDIAVLDARKGTVVGFTRARDEEAFNRILETGSDPSVHKKVGDWTVFSDEQANLDLVGDVDRKLSDAGAFQAAMDSTPDAAIARAYVARSAIRRGFSGVQQQAGSSATSVLGLEKADWASAAALSHDDGIELQVNAHGAATAKAVKTYTPSFTDDIPSDALLVISFDGAGNQLNSITQGSVPQLGTIERAIGVKVRDLQELVGGEGALYVRAGNPIPEVTLLAQERNERKAERTIEKVVAHLAGGNISPHPTTIEGVPMQQLDLGPVSILYGTFEGKLVVTDSANALRELKSTNDKLADSETFKAASDAANLPDQSTGFVYANLKDAVPVIESLGRLGGGGLPPDVDRNLKPLRSFIAYGTKDGDLTTSVAFLQTN